MLFSPNYPYLYLYTPIDQIKQANNVAIASTNCYEVLQKQRRSPQAIQHEYGKKGTGHIIELKSSTANIYLYMIIIHAIIFMEHDLGISTRSGELITGCLPICCSTKCLTVDIPEILAYTDPLLFGLSGVLKKRLLFFYCLGMECAYDSSSSPFLQFSTACGFSCYRTIDVGRFGVSWKHLFSPLNTLSDHISP